MPGRGYSHSSVFGNVSPALLYPTENPCLGNRVLAAALSLNLATLIAASASVDVRTTAQCPSAQGISERLAPLLPAAAGAAGSRDVALVDVIEGTPDGNTDVLIRLLRPDTSEVGNRRVTLGGSCDDKAEAVAAIVAAWETDPRSDDTLDEPAPPPTTNRSPNEPVVSVPKGSATWDLSCGAGVGAALLGGVAANGMLEAVTGKHESRWRLRVAASTQTARTIDLSTSGHAEWRHTSFVLGALWRTLGPWPLSFDAGPVLGWAALSGTGFFPNRQERVFEYGAMAGLRLGHTWGRWTVWAEGRAIMWFLEEKATANGGADSRDLPPIDATASLGVSLALFP